MWAASSDDEECPVLLWLAHAGEQVESLTACDATWNGREAVLEGWGALARMRVREFHSREDLSEDPQARIPSATMGKSFHFSGRAQERGF